MTLLLTSRNDIHCRFLLTFCKLRLFILLAVVFCLLGILFLYHVFRESSLAVDYDYFVSISSDDGMVPIEHEDVDSLVYRGAGFRKGNESLPWLFPVGVENGKSNRIAETLKLMDEYASAEHVTSVNRKVKYILRTRTTEPEDWIEGQQRFILNKCPITDCYLTSDLYNKRETADVLLITKLSRSEVRKLLPKPTHQIWIAQTMESPVHNKIDLSALRGLINWTVNYRYSSTVSVQYYVQFLPKDQVPARFRSDVDQLALMRQPADPIKASYSTVNFAEGKKKKIAWFVSNCDAPNGRRQYAEELHRYIPVDIFGGCGEHHCVKEQGGCRKMLSADYKFYLAFENSNCFEYITEKASFQALASDIVPIVMGARPEDYAKLLPPDSFIHVDDFKTPRDLADYLREVDKNDTLYNSYFRWRDSWTPLIDSYWCSLCFMLHYRDDVNYVHWYDDFSGWWFGACSARPADKGQAWRTWRPEGFWDRLNLTNVHRLNAAELDRRTLSKDAT